MAKEKKKKTLQDKLEAIKAALALETDQIGNKIADLDNRYASMEAARDFIDDAINELSI